MTFLLFVFLALTSFADTKPAAIFTVSVENDVATIGGPGTDQSYTQGLKLAYVKTIDHVPAWASTFTEETTTPANLGFGASQKLYTPAGIDNDQLTLNDRPYAAWLSLDSFYHFQDEHRSHLIALSVGIIGPEAGGENMQNNYHRATNYKLAEGWHHQLATEPTLELSYQQRLRIFESERSFDAIAIYGGDLGNVLIDGYAGAMIRFGFSLPSDLGPTRPSLLNGERFITASPTEGDSFYFYGFASARVIGVAKNIFLDGNTFKSSHRVKKKLVVFENELGISANYKKMNLTWHFVTLSPEFEEKDQYHSFASISLSYLFD